MDDKDLVDLHAFARSQIDQIGSSNYGEACRRTFERRLRVAFERVIDQIRQHGEVGSNGIDGLAFVLSDAKVSPMHVAAPMVFRHDLVIRVTGLDHLGEVRSRYSPVVSMTFHMRGCYNDGLNVRIESDAQPLWDSDHDLTPQIRTFAETQVWKAFDAWRLEASRGQTKA